jgi:hypothetical protein
MPSHEFLTPQTAENATRSHVTQRRFGLSSFGDDESKGQCQDCYRN